MEGNDFILFKHGCGNDSTYPIDHNPACKPHTWTSCRPYKTREYEITDEEKERFQKPCKNKIFYHVEVEFLGNQSYNYNYEYPNDETETGHPKKDSNPVIFKIRNATLLDLGLTESGKEEIWFDRAQEITLKSYRIKKEFQRRSVLYKLDLFCLHNSIIYLLFVIKTKRVDLKRKTTLQRKINPSDCNFKQIGNQNLFLNWGIFAENFPEEILQDLHFNNPDEAFVNIRVNQNLNNRFFSSRWFVSYLQYRANRTWSQTDSFG